VRAGPLRLLDAGVVARLQESGYAARVTISHQRRRGDRAPRISQPMTHYPYTIDNGQGETLTFTGISRGPEGERADVEGAAKPGAGPPMHVHYLQDEGVRVISGRIGYQVLGGAPQFAGPGDMVVWPAGTAHKWWNAGDTEARMTGWCSPPGNVEYYLDSVFASTRENGGRPGIFDAAFLMTRYRTEFAMLELPAFVRRVVMPLAYVLGRVLGKHAKYKNAPPPFTGGTAHR
jgi:quercetin dioxygenase-like cupin family protein